MIALGIIVTIIAGVISGVLGHSIDLPELGVITAIAIMGGFIMAEIKKINKE